MKKLIGFGILGLALLAWAPSAQAASSSRGAKSNAAILYSTSVSSVSTTGSATLYAVTLSSGTAGTDYVQLWDLASIGGTTLATNTGLKAKIVVSSATQNTVVNFDPPLLFKNGIIAANSATTMTSLITFEAGRASAGN